jgi:hypothetical protein
MPARDDARAASSFDCRSGCKATNTVYAAAAAVASFEKIWFRGEIELILSVASIDGVHGLEHGNVKNSHLARANPWRNLFFNLDGLGLCVPFRNRIGVCGLDKKRKS